jgi:uncharacterized protein YndB with AHSA1/START domain
MVRIEGSIVIKCPVDKVFAYATDVKSMPKWQSTMHEVEQTSPGPMGIGTTLKWVTRGRIDRGMMTTAKVTGYELNKMLSIDIDWRSIAGESTFFVESIEGGTKFTQRNDMKLSRRHKLFSPLLVWAMRKEIKRALNHLESILEAQL